MKKACANCGKRIPRAAPLCTYCGQAQPQSGPPPPWAASGETPPRGTPLPAGRSASAASPIDIDVEFDSGPLPAGPGPGSAASPAASRTAPTLVSASAFASSPGATSAAATAAPAGAAASPAPAPAGAAASPAGAAAASGGQASAPAPGAAAASNAAPAIGAAQAIGAAPAPAIGAAQAIAAPAIGAAQAIAAPAIGATPAPAIGGAASAPEAPRSSSSSSPEAPRSASSISPELTPLAAAPDELGPPMVQAPTRRPAEAAPPAFEADPAGEEEEPPAEARPLRPAPTYGYPQTLEPPFFGRARLLQIAAGTALIVVFCLPWQGARSWEMLRYLQGGDFVRQLGLLVGGAVLLSTGILPVPGAFRAACGAIVGLSLLCLGGVMLNTSQRLLGILVAVLLPASLLVRTHARRARLPRLLGLMAVLSLLSLYIVPRDDVAPIRVAVDLVYYQRDDMARFIGTYLLLPLPLVSLATVALLGADVAVIGELLGWLLLCWGPGALLVLAIDNTQTYMAAATLGCAASAAYGVAELLRRITKTVEPGR